MNEQPYALRLAEDLDACGHPLSADAADELRHLHEAHDWQYKMARERLSRIKKLDRINQELLTALKELKAVMPIFPKDGDCLVGYRERYNAAQDKASAAIAKYKG